MEGWINVSEGRNEDKRELCGVLMKTFKKLRYLFDEF